MAPFAISLENFGDNDIPLDSDVARWIKPAPAMAHAIDAGGRLIAVSDLWLETLGYAREEVLGRLSSDFMTAESRQRAMDEVLPEFIRRGRCENVECQMTRKDGKILDLLLSATLLRSGGEPGYSSLAMLTDVTAIKAAALRGIEREALFRGLVEDPSAYVAHMTPEGQLTYVNQAYARRYGARPEDMIGKSMLAFVPSEAQAAVEKHLQTICAATQPQELEARMLSANGEMRWVGWSSRATRDGAGVVTDIHSVGRDIERRVAAEQRLLESETRYRLYRMLADNSNDMKVLVQSDDQQIFVSPACQMILGFTPEDMLRLGPYDLIHPEDQEKVREHLAHPRERREHADYRMRRKDGRYLWVESHVRAITADVGPPMRLIVVRDIEQRVVAERKIKESEARFRLLAENTSDAIVFWTTPGDRISYVSPAITALLGHAPEEFAELAPSEFVHPDDIDALTTCHASLGGDVRAATIVHRARHKNDNWVWIEIALTRVGGVADATVGTIGALRDVSQRQRQAEAMRQALDEAENAGRIKAEFLANMSHELRTPLAGILGVHEMLHDDETLNERQRRLVKLAEQSGRMLLNVVNDVLDYSKMEAGKLELVTVPFSTADLVGGSIAIIAGLAAAKHLDVRVSSDEEIAPYLIGDEDRLRQILLNFINNAIKFTRAGHIALTVERVGTTAGGQRIRFSVSDTGIGIPRDKINRLFQRFSQVDGSTAREFGGSGLGLAIVKRLVELMGGELGVESVPGEGSTFWFSVTLAVSKSDTAGAELSPGAPQFARSARILVAEDIEVNQEIIRGMLESAGHKVHMVANGAEAILAAASQNYEIVLMDIQMPLVDGVVATKGIRGLAGPASRLPIIAMTANVLAPKVAHFLASGMDDHVGKPFSREELLAVVARCLPSRGASEDFPPRDPCIAESRGRPEEPKPLLERHPVVEAAKIESLGKLLGEAKVETMLANLATRLQDKIADDVGAKSRAILADDAHKLMSLSGMLGFMTLSDRCAELEATLEAGKDAAESLNEVRQACADALAEISLRLGSSPPVAARA